jgi:hypothetical protein
MRSILILLVLFSLCSAMAEAAREIEPNNHWLQATLIDGKDPVEGALNDEQDVYKLLLPGPGKVTVTLADYPHGADLTLEILGFRKDPIVPISEEKTRGQKKLSVTFDAQEIIGYLSLTTTPAEKICKDQWCIMRLVTNGPYYLLRSGSTLPATWNGQPIFSPPDYRLTIVHPEFTRESKRQEEARRAVADLPLYKEPRYGLQFRHQSDWRLRTKTEDRILVTPVRQEGADIQVEIMVRKKSQFPGSSPELQLNLAEKNLLDANAQIAKRGVMTIMQRSAPYLLSTYSMPGRELTVALLQLVLDKNDYYFWISYSAPTTHYAQYTPGFATILKTLEFSHPEPRPVDDHPDTGSLTPPK